MSDLRKDPFSGGWVIIAGERPLPRLPLPEVAPSDEVCPFCPGQERQTPHEVLAYRPPMGGGHLAPWTVRAFPSRQPTLRIESSGEREAEGLYDRQGGLGAHEVVVETPDHLRALTDLNPSEIELVLAAWRDRMHDLSRDQRFRCVVVAKQHGPTAGATVRHSHSQVLALPTVPPRLAGELRHVTAHHQAHDRCLTCDVVRQERRDRRRLVFENEDCIVVTPFASRAPFETWIIPRRHQASFDDAPVSERPRLAAALRLALVRLRRALDDPPYHLVLVSAPFSERGSPSFHYRFELTPRLVPQTAVETASGCCVNPIPPEEAARFLRELDLD